MTKTDGSRGFLSFFLSLIMSSLNYVAIKKDLGKLLACEQISRPRTPESSSRACWQAKKLPPHHTCVVHRDCVSRNVAIITTLLYAMLAMIVLISLHWMFHGKKTVNKSQRPAGIIATSDGHVLTLFQTVLKPAQPKISNKTEISV